MAIETLGSATAVSSQVQQSTSSVTRQASERRQQPEEPAALQVEQERSPVRETTNAQGQRIGRILNEKA